MEMQGQVMGGPAARSAAALSIDTTCIVQKLDSVKEARALPQGAVIGDQHGGLTFTDAVAAALEARSLGGWQELRVPSGEVWTIIVLNR